MGNNKRFFPVACSKVRVTGILSSRHRHTHRQTNVSPLHVPIFKDVKNRSKEYTFTYLPPSLVKSGFTPQTCSTALLAAVKFQCLGLATHHFPSCCNETSNVFLLLSFLNSSLRCLYTSSLTSALSMLGTVRMENFPITLAGITVLAPGAEKAPSMPWMDRDGYRHLIFEKGSIKKKQKFPHLLSRWEAAYRAINVRSLSLCTAVLLPRLSYRFSMLKLISA